MLNQKKIIQVFYFIEMTELIEILKHVDAIRHLLTILIAKSDDNEAFRNLVNNVSFDNDNNDSSSDDENLPHFSEQNSLLNDITPKSDKPKRSIFNSSKFLNAHERELVMQFLDEERMNEINKLPAHKQASYTKLLIKKHLNIDISTYMVNKILTLKRQQTHDNDDEDNDNNNNNNQRRPQLI